MSNPSETPFTHEGAKPSHSSEEVEHETTQDFRAALSNHSGCGAIPYSRGRSTFDAYPTQRAAENFDAFADAVLGPVHICRNVLTSCFLGVNQDGSDAIAG
jgi:hypothetical protein